MAGLTAMSAGYFFMYKNFVSFGFFQSKCYNTGMVITYLGKQFFKVQYGDMVIAFNPVSKQSKLSAKAPHFGSAIALSTTNHADYNGFEAVEYAGTVPFAISGPGDYEVKDIFIKGAISEAEIDGKKYINTIYMLTVDSISICFMGCLGTAKVSADTREAIGSPDIIFVPISGTHTVDAKDAYNLAASFEPHIIIPMDYDDGKDALKTFLKEAGEEKKEAIEKLTLKRKDLDGMESDVVVLESVF